MTGPERTSQTRLGRTEDRDDWDAEECGEMHCAGIVREQQRAFAELSRKLIERRLANAIHAMSAQGRFNRAGSLLVRRRAKENPLHRPLLRDGERDFRETLGQPAFGWAVFCARTKSELRRGAVRFDAGEELPHFGRLLRPAQFASHS